MLNSSSTVYVAGHRGMVGSAIIRSLEGKGVNNIVTRTHLELDLTDQQAVRQLYKDNSIDYVVLAAAKVGGIYANNTYPAEFIYSNLAIQNNVIHEAWQAGVQRLLFLGSSCIYPKLAPQPMSESSLLTGLLEPTNEPYAVAKIAGIKMCESYNRQYGTHYRSIMPTNLYGPNDNFNLENSHVVPALIRKFHEAKEADQESVVVWGSGKAFREFLHVDDMADASVFVMDLEDDVYETNITPMNSHINVGSGTDITISDLAKLIREVVGFDGKIIFDADKPDGSPKKLLDVTRINNMGWRAKISLKQGLTQTYGWFQHNVVRK